MLAYVFWHQPKADSLPAEYETALAAFHQALGRRSNAFRIATVPWAPAGPCYEDWYPVRDSAELDPLNDAAVSGARKAPHDAAAARAGWGAAGLYALKLGDEHLTKARHAVWFAKPPEVAYDSIYDRLGPLCEITPAMLWQRRLVLGPTPEFCFLSSRKVDLMDIVEQATYLDLDPVVTR